MPTKEVQDMVLAVLIGLLIVMVVVMGSYLVNYDTYVENNRATTTTTTEQP